MLVGWEWKKGEQGDERVEPKGLMFCFIEVRKELEILLYGNLLGLVEGV